MKRFASIAIVALAACLLAEHAGSQQNIPLPATSSAAPVVTVAPPPSAGGILGKITTYAGQATAGSQGLTPVLATVSLTAQTAAIGATSLLASAATGLYTVNAYVNSTVVCATPGPGVVGLQLSWTDETGAHATQTVPIFASGGATPATTLALGTATGYAWGTANVFAAAATAIQFATSYVACTAGTGTYALRIALEQVF